LKDALPKIKNKEGSSKYSLSMLVADAKFPVQSVEVTSDKRVFPAYKRDYNYWEIHNPGQPLAKTVDVKVTCTNTRSFVVKNIDPSSKDPFKALSGC
jgi:expansin (peptidoglycan-binding protein)